MSDTDMERQKILEELQRVSEHLQTQKGFKIAAESLYNLLEVVSALLLAWHEKQGQPGWARDVLRQNKQPLFSTEEARLIEQALQPFGPQIQKLFEKTGAAAAAATAEERKQQGGGPDPLAAVQMPLQEGALVDKPMAFNPKDISIDGAYYWLMDTLDSYDNQAREVARKSGIMRFESCLDTEGKPLPGPCPDLMVGSVPVPRRLIFPVLSGLLDMLRLLLGNPLFDVAIVRIFLSISLSVMDLMRGDWKTALISFMGVLGAHAAVMSFFLKMVRYTWLLMSPDLQVQLRTDGFKATKSIIVGFVLWVFTLVAPMPIREGVSAAFARLQDFGKGLKEQLDQVEKTLQPPPDSRVKIIFPALPLATLPAMDDIQNLQAVMHEPSLVCTEEIQNIIQGMLSNVPLRLILELMNVPTVPQDIAVTCPEGIKPLSQTVEDLGKKIQVVVDEGPTPSEPAAAAVKDKPKKGGKQKTRRTKPRNQKRKTRRRGLACPLP